MHICLLRNDYDPIVNLEKVGYKPSYTSIVTSVRYQCLLNTLHTDNLYDSVGVIRGWDGGALIWQRTSVRGIVSKTTVTPDN